MADSITQLQEGYKELAESFRNVTHTVHDSNHPAEVRRTANTRK